MTEATVSFAGNLTDGQACDRLTLGNRRALATPRNRSRGRPEVRSVPQFLVAGGRHSGKTPRPGRRHPGRRPGPGLRGPASATGGTAKVRAFRNSPDTPRRSTSTSTAPRPSRTWPTAPSATTSRCPRGPTTSRSRWPPRPRATRPPSRPTCASAAPGHHRRHRLTHRRRRPPPAQGARDRDTDSRHPSRRCGWPTPAPDAPAVDVQAKLAGRWIRVVRTSSSARPAATCWPRPASTGCGSSPPRPAPWSRTSARSGSRAAPPTPPGRSASPEDDYPGFDVFVSWTADPAGEWAPGSIRGPLLAKWGGVSSWSPCGTTRGRPGSSRRRPTWSSSWTARCWPTPAAPAGAGDQPPARLPPPRRRRPRHRLRPSARRPTWV